MSLYQRRATYARNVKVKPLRRVTTSLNGYSRDGINTRVKNDNDDDAYYPFYRFKQAIVPRFKRAEALCWKSVINTLRIPNFKRSGCRNRNDYAQMVASIEYATYLHAHDKRPKFEAIARVSDYQATARVSPTSRQCCEDLQNNA
jgi:hypothetical protein